MSARTRLLGVLWAAGVVSVVCNILAAEPGLVARGVGAWMPVALLLVVEVLARSPLPSGWLRWASTAGATGVAAAAAVASFNHMHEVALAAGETQLVAYLFPLSVDGLAVVASVALLGTHQTDTDAAEGDDALVLDVDPPSNGSAHLEVAPVNPVGPVAAESVSSPPGPIRFGPRSASMNGVGNSNHNQGAML